jgi:hypothetical protein
MAVPHKLLIADVMKSMGFAFNAPTIFQRPEGLQSLRHQLDRHLLELCPGPAPAAIRLEFDPADLSELSQDGQARDVASVTQLPPMFDGVSPFSDESIRQKFQRAFIMANAVIEVTARH